MDRYANRVDMPRVVRAPQQQQARGDPFDLRDVMATARQTPWFADAIRQWAYSTVGHPGMRGPAREFCSPQGHSRSCTEQWGTPRWISLGFGSDGDVSPHRAVIKLLVSGLCTRYVVIGDPGLAETVHAWGREIWWRVPPAGQTPIWKVPHEIAPSVFQFLLAARLRWGWPCELIHLVVEWAVNTQGFNTDHGVGEQIPYRFITSKPPTAVEKSE